MMRALYIIVITVLFLFLIMIYFTNIMLLGSMVMYIGSQDNSISVGLGLMLIIIISFILGFCTYGLFTTFVKKKPKDFDEFDI